MRIVARLRSGRLVYYAAGVFYLDGNGSISARRMRRLDSQGAIEWLDEDVRVDFRTGTGTLGPRRAAVIHDDGHRFNPSSAAKKVAIAAVLFVSFWAIVIGSLFYSSARSVAEARATSAREAQAAAARVTFGAYDDLVAATQSGTNRQRYAAALKRAHAARVNFDADDPRISEFDARLAMADRYYEGADEVWRLTSGRDPQASFDEFRARRGDLGMTSTNPDDALQELWAGGYDQVAGALQQLEAFEGTSAPRSSAQITIAQVGAVIWERISRADTPPQPTRTASTAL